MTKEHAVADTRLDSQAVGLVDSLVVVEGHMHLGKVAVVDILVEEEDHLYDK